MGDQQDSARDDFFEKYIFPLELEEIARRQEKLRAKIAPGQEKSPGESVSGGGEERSPWPLLDQANKPREIFPRTPSWLETKCADWENEGFFKSIVARAVHPIAGWLKTAKLRSFGEEDWSPESRFPDQRPSTTLGIVGLALSGGGIRSATFNLGVVQALAEHGIFRWIDYISTVSGGGYLGSCLSSILSRPGNSGRFPFDNSASRRELPSLRHLRNSSNYLAPRGPIEAIRIPALLLRGSLIHLAVPFPMWSPPYG